MELETFNNYPMGNTIIPPIGPKESLSPFLLLVFWLGDSKVFEENLWGVINAPGDRRPTPRTLSLGHLTYDRGKRTS